MDGKELERMAQRLKAMGLVDLDVALAAAQAQRRGPPPVYKAELPPPFAMRMGYINNYNFETNRDDCNNKSVIRQTMRPSIEHGPAPSLDAVKPISLREVANKVNHIHSNRVLFVTITYAPYRLVGTCFLVEDEMGDCLMMSAYNYVDRDEDPDEVFPVGTHLAILAPFMRNAKDDKKLNLMLRCDNPQCIIRFDTKAQWQAAKQGHGWSETAKVDEKNDPSELRKQGNAAFGKGKMTLASKIYKTALMCASIQRDDQIACLSNRAGVSLNQEQYEEVEQDARAVLDLDPRHVKAQYRLAKALVRLGNGKTTEALEIAKKLVSQEKDSSSVRSFRELVTDCERLVKEDQQGVYDLDAMRREARASNMEKKKKTTFHADFVSTKIQLGATISRKNKSIEYRGCLACERIATGELLTASKAFCYVPEEDSRLCMQFSPHSNEYDRTDQIQMVSNIVTLLRKRPCLGRILYQLSAAGGDGTDKMLLESGFEKIDIPRIRGILHSNAFGQTSDQDDVLHNWQVMKETMKLGRPMTEQEHLERFPKQERRKDGSGLWIRESFFNHSCTPNCAWTQIGDHMFMRATRPISVDEELCVSYVPLDSSFEERQETFSNWIHPGVGFVCRCEWCDLMQSNPTTLQKMQTEVHAAYQKAAHQVTFTQGQVTMATAANQALSPKRRHEILQAYSHLPLHLQHNTIARLWVMEGTCCNETGKPREALEAFEKAAAIGFAMRGTSGGGMDYAKDLWRVVGSAMRCDNSKRSRQALEEIWTTVFNVLSKDEQAEKEAAFVHLTHKYALPWWMDRQSVARERVLASMAKDVMKGKISSVGGGSHGTRKKKKKKGRR